MKRRADSLERGDVIQDGDKTLRVIAAGLEYGPYDGGHARVHLVTEVNRWGANSVSYWATDYRTEFEVVQMDVTVTVLHDVCELCGEADGNVQEVGVLSPVAGCAGTFMYAHQKCADGAAREMVR